MTDCPYTMVLYGPGGQRDKITRWDIDPAEQGWRTYLPTPAYIAELIDEDVAEMAAREEATP